MRNLLLKITSYIFIVFFTSISSLSAQSIVSGVVKGLKQGDTATIKIQKMLKPFTSKESEV